MDDTLRMIATLKGFFIAILLFTLIFWTACLIKLWRDYLRQERGKEKDKENKDE